MWPVSRTELGQHAQVCPGCVCRNVFPSLLALRHSRKPLEQGHVLTQPYLCLPCWWHCVMLQMEEDTDVCCLQLQGEVWVAECPLQLPGTGLLFEVRGTGNPTMLLCPELCHGALLSVLALPWGDSDLESVCTWDWEHVKVLLTQCTLEWAAERGQHPTLFFDNLSHFPCQRNRNRQTTDLSKEGIFHVTISIPCLIQDIPSQLCKNANEIMEAFFFFLQAVSSSSCPPQVEQ